MKALGLLALVLALGACSRQDKRETREDLRKTGTVVKKELRNDAAFLKEEALKARAETQKGVKKLKKDINSDDRPDHPRDEPPAGQQ